MAASRLHARSPRVCAVALLAVALGASLGVGASAFVCPRSFGKAAQPIPNVVHQPWLGGATLRWEQVLAMMSVRYVLRPLEYVLYYDRAPSASATWACAQALVDRAVYKEPRATIHGQRLLYPQHKSDLMRIDLLEAQGGMYVDHDAFVLRTMDPLRRCGADFMGGHEVWSADVQKLNNGVLLARPNATFLKLWRDGYKNFDHSQWDYNSCIVPWKLAQEHPGLALPVREIGPIPVHLSAAKTDEYFHTAIVAHVTGLFNAPWRQEAVHKYRVLRTISERVLGAAAAMEAAGSSHDGGRNSSLRRWCATHVRRAVEQSWRRTRRRQRRQLHS